MKYDVKTLKLAKKGKLKIEWALAHMPVLELIRKRFKKEKTRNIKVIFSTSVPKWVPFLSAGIMRFMPA